MFVKVSFGSGFRPSGPVICWGAGCGQDSPSGVGRFGGQAGTQAPDATPLPAQNHGSRAGSGQAGPEALSTSSLPNICGLDAAGSWDWPCPDRPVRCAGRGARAGRARWSCSTPGGRLEPARSPPGTFGWAGAVRRQGPGAQSRRAAPATGVRWGVRRETFGRRRLLPSVAGRSPGVGIVHRPGPGCPWLLFRRSVRVRGPAGRAREGVEPSPC